MSMSWLYTGIYCVYPCIYQYILYWYVVDFVQDPVPPLTLGDWQPSWNWLEYVYLPGTAHPMLCWLLTTLEEWIRENLQEELGFQDKADMRVQPGTCWTPAELNNILHTHVVNIDNFWLCRVGVRPVQRRDVCQMLSFWYVKEELSFLQPQGLQYILLDYIILHTKVNILYTSIYWYIQ